MASTTTTEPIVPQSNNGHLPRSAKRGPQTPRPMESMVAAASVITSKTIKRDLHESWQAEAWDMYDEVGELRFVANAVAGAMSHARLFVGRLGEGDRNEPGEVEAGTPVDIFRQLGGGPTGKSELLRRLAIQMFVPGDGWIVGLPPDALEAEQGRIDPGAGLTPEGDLRLSDLVWHVFSVTEVKFKSGEIEIDLGGNEKRTIPEDRCYAVRVWRPHPRRWWTADSPVRSNLPILRELIGLTKHIGASIDSRLAGAGMLVLPESVTVMGGIAESSQEDDDPEVDPVLAALMDAMITPIKNRDSAAAVVPILLKASDEAAAAIGQNSLIRFSTPFDERSKDLRDEAIRRLALGLDTTPEMLLGMGATNHWSAWLLDEINAKIHIEPVLSMICDALTTGFLRPALEEAGVLDADSYVVWWDLSDLTLRPDRSGEAQALHDRGVISAEALRRANGFDESDAPPADADGPEMDVAVKTALELVVAAPSLIGQPGLPAIVAQIREILTPAGEASQSPLSPADIPPTQPPAETTGGAPGGTPDTQGDIPDPGLPASSKRRPSMPRDEDE